MPKSSSKIRKIIIHTNKKILFSSLLLLAVPPALSMEALTKQTKSEIKRLLREMECNVAFGDIQFVDEPDSQDEQRRFLKNRYDETKTILETNGISVPKGRDFSWLRSIKEELYQDDLINFNRKNLGLYDEAQRLAGTKYRKIKRKTANENHLITDKITKDSD